MGSSSTGGADAGVVRSLRSIRASTANAGAGEGDEGSGKCWGCQAGRRRGGKGEKVEGFGAQGEGTAFEEDDEYAVERSCGSLKR